MNPVEVNRKLNPRDRAKFDNLNAGVAQNQLSNEDLTNALVELAELYAEQDDALVELAEIIAEGE